MKKKVFFITLCVLGLSKSIQAQRQETVYVLGQESTEPKFSKDRDHLHNLERSFVIKYDIYRLFLGEVLFSFEKNMGNKHALELEAGPTISNIYSFGDSNSDYYSEEINGTWTNYYVERKSKLGFTAGLSYKFYPLDNYKTLSKIWIGPQIKFRSYTTNYFATLQDYNIDFDSKRNNLNFSFNIGHQTWYSTLFSIDYYIGVGVGKLQDDGGYTSKTETQNIGNVNYNPNYVNQATLIVTGGIKIGFGQ